MVSGCLLADPRFHHWFVVPILVCGTLIGVDAVEWLRGRLDLFDPIGVLGMLGTYFFFVSPLLCIPLGTTLGHRVPPADWREWLGRMAVLNIGGVVAYLTARDYVTRRTPLLRRRRWTVNSQTWSPVLWTIMGVSVVLQAMVYAKYGGVGGYIAETFKEGPSFQGMGWVFMVSETFPVLAAFTYAIYCARSGRTPNWSELAVLLVAIAVLQIFFGGLKGSRSTTVWALFWIVGIIHLVVRPIPRMVIVAGIGILGTFMYAYGFYKSHGPEAVRALTSASARAKMSEEGGRDLTTVLIADLSRCDVQAYLLYRLSAPTTVSDYQLAYGRTYLLAATLPIPNRFLWFQPPSKTMFGTEAEYGRGSYHRETWETSKVYGVAGETMLNFGPFAAPFSYLVLGAVVGLVKRAFDAWDRKDPRTLLLPYLTNLCFVILVGDSDNVVFFLIKNGAVFFVTILLISRMWSTVMPASGETILTSPARSLSPTPPEAA